MDSPIKVRPVIGWYGFGIDIGEKVGCFLLSAKNQCGKPLANVVCSLKGRDHGYRAEGWTSAEGKSCFQVMASEKKGGNHDYDDLGGETFWVDITLKKDRKTPKKVLDFENPLFDARRHNEAH